MGHAGPAAGLQGGFCHRGRLAACTSRCAMFCRIRSTAGTEGHADEVDCHEKHEETSSIFWPRCATRWKFSFILLFSFIRAFFLKSVGEERHAPVS